MNKWEPSTNPVGSPKLKTTSEFQRFENLTKGLLAVSKEEVKEAEKKRLKAKKGNG